jgi:hypothetical protein
MSTHPKYESSTQVRYSCESQEDLCGHGFMDFIHRPKSKILKKYIKN